MRGASLIFGLIFVLTGSLGAFRLMGGQLQGAVQYAQILVVVLLPLGSALLAFGVPDVWKALLSCRHLLLPQTAEPRSSQSIRVLRYMIVSVYAAGGLTLVLALIVILASTPEAPSAASCFQHLAAALFGPAYAVIASEGILRPIKLRIEAAPASA